MSHTLEPKVLRYRAFTGDSTRAGLKTCDRYARLLYDAYVNIFFCRGSLDNITVLVINLKNRSNGTKETDKKNS